MPLQLVVTRAASLDDMRDDRQTGLRRIFGARPPRLTRSDFDRVLATKAHRQIDASRALLVTEDGIPRVTVSFLERGADGGDLLVEGSCTGVFGAVSLRFAMDAAGELADAMNARAFTMDGGRIRSADDHDPYGVWTSSLEDGAREQDKQALRDGLTALEAPWHGADLVPCVLDLVLQPAARVGSLAALCRQLDCMEIVRTDGMRAVIQDRPLGPVTWTTCR